MTRSSKLWRVAAALFVFINVAGGIWAAAMGEGGHAATHAGLLLAVIVAWQLVPWGRREKPLKPQIDEGRIEYLQQSVDAIALEVERIGEKQRFSDKLRVEQGKSPEGGDGR